MALNATTLKTAIVSRLNTLAAANPQGASRDAIWQAVAEEIVGHIQNFAQVTTVIQAGSLASGVLSGGATAPVTGTSAGAAGSAIT